MIKIADEPQFPADDDIVGQIAISLAVHDVTETPKAMTAEELQAFEKLFCIVWQEEKYRYICEKLQDFRSREKIAHKPTGGSYPIHYGMAYWRDYIKEARIALNVAEKLYGRQHMKEKKRTNNGAKDE